MVVVQTTGELAHFSTGSLLDLIIVQPILVSNRLYKGRAFELMWLNSTVGWIKKQSKAHKRLTYEHVLFGQGKTVCNFLASMAFNKATNGQTDIEQDNGENLRTYLEEAIHWNSGRFSNFHHFYYMSVCLLLYWRQCMLTMTVLSCPNKKHSYFNLLCALICFLDCQKSSLHWICCWLKTLGWFWWKHCLCII